MSKDTNDNYVVARLRTDNSNGYLVVTVEIGKINDRGEYDSLRYDDKGYDIRGMTLRAQADTHSEVTHFYGIEAGWSDGWHSMISEDEAETAYKTLRKFNKGMQALEAKFSYPADFTDYVLRALDVLKVDYFYNSYERNMQGVTAIKDGINRALREFKNKYNLSD